MAAIDHVAADIARGRGAHPEAFRALDIDLSIPGGPFLRHKTLFAAAVKLGHVPRP